MLRAVSHKNSPFISISAHLYGPGQQLEAEQVAIYKGVDLGAQRSPQCRRVTATQIKVLGTWMEEKMHQVFLTYIPMLALLKNGHVLKKYHRGLMKNSHPLASPPQIL